MSPDAELEREIRSLEERLLDRRVRSDPALLRELLAEEFLEHGSSGRTWSRAEMIEALRAERGELRFRLHDFRARRIASGAVLATYRLLTEPEPPEPPRASLRSSLWVQRGGRWVIVFHQGTRTSVS